MIIPDNETKVDLLNNEAIATNIVGLLREHSGQPVTIGVHGDWGAGKSSVLQMIEKGLEEDPDILCIRFDGWRFQGFEDAKIALIEGLVTGLIEKRPLLTKTAESVKNIFKRIDWLKLAKHGGGLALTAFTGLPSPDQLRIATTALASLANNPTAVLDKDRIKSALESADGILKPSEDIKRVPEEIQEFRKAFDKLLEDAHIKQLVVLIDDLDRCLPKTVIETLEAIRLFVFTEKTAFVVAADEAMIEYSVREHFPDLPETTGPRDYARNYLEKLIQVPFRLPSLGEAETRIYVTLLLIGSRLGEGDEDFQKLIVEARDLMKRPWMNTPLDAATIKRVLGAKLSQISDTISISDQIGQALAVGTNGNPRQVKRFLNTLLLRKRMAEARGFGEEIKLPVLAKLMLAERFIPELFDQLAIGVGSDPKGSCPEIIQLESHKDEKPESETCSQTVTAKGKRADLPEENSTSPLPAWLSTNKISAWAKIEPKLSDVDLRPYLFVARERKNYFGENTVLGKIAVIAEQLFGEKITVQAMKKDLELLTEQEASSLFEIVRGRIIRNGNLKIKPLGIEGLIVLVKSHVELQSNLVDFLENLPSAQIGPWVVGGWSGTIVVADQVSRLNTLINKWSNATDNSSLKSVAQGALTLPTGK